MEGTTTLEQVEALAAQLPLTERLKLAAHLCQQLSTILRECLGEKTDLQERTLEERLRLADQLMAECEGIEDDSQGFDTAEMIRQMRDERIKQICRRDA